MAGAKWREEGGGAVLLSPGHNFLISSNWYSSSPEAWMGEREAIQQKEGKRENEREKKKRKRERWNKSIVLCLSFLPLPSHNLSSPLLLYLVLPFPTSTPLLIPNLPSLPSASLSTYLPFSLPLTLVPIPPTLLLQQYKYQQMYPSFGSRVLPPDRMKLWLWNLITSRRFVLKHQHNDERKCGVTWLIFLSGGSREKEGERKNREM